MSEEAKGESLALRESRRKKEEDDCLMLIKSTEEKREERIEMLERKIEVLTKKMDFYEKYAHRHTGTEIVNVKISGV
ncbi:hypothetical protein LCGC14_2238440 [marine sediment metagenome]|uniref:Uncharacterized protein n=1 Tax=marine sediment metagenome TaxID=412755 RepID=A0A0F9G173_9ZZZZ|nr:hypothetical protein [Candidatus Aminicenantes bacterium]